MSSNVVTIAYSVADQLRLLADQFDAGVHPAEGVTVIAGKDVFHCSTKPDTTNVMQVVWDCNYAVHKLMDRYHG